MLRQFFDPRPLASEIDRVMHDGLVADVPRSGEIRFQYVPMMSAKTPASLSLLDRVEGVAATLFGSSVLPTRAKGVRVLVQSRRGTRILPLRSPASDVSPTSSRSAPRTVLSGSCLVPTSRISAMHFAVSESMARQTRPYRHTSLRPNPAI